jgi:AraC-like DNA-binding protein
MDCGFASGAYFASVFRSHSDCSPREFRAAAGLPSATITIPACWL